MRSAASKGRRDGPARRTGSQDPGTLRLLIFAAAAVAAAAVVLVGAFALLRDSSASPEPFTAVSTAGGKVAVPDPERPTVLVFYRGFF